MMKKNLIFVLAFAISNNLYADDALLKIKCMDFNKVSGPNGRIPDLFKDDSRLDSGLMRLNLAFYENNIVIIRMTGLYNIMDRKDYVAQSVQPSRYEGLTQFGFGSEMKNAYIMDDKVSRYRERTIILTEAVKIKGKEYYYGERSMTSTDKALRNPDNMTLLICQKQDN
jgi:hypothetical protein